MVPTRADGEVIAFVEKPPRDQAPTNWINAGTYVLEPAVLDAIPPRLTVSIERETFPRMLEEPGRLYAMQSDAYWLDIGTPQKYFEAQLDVPAGRLGRPPAPGAIERGDGVWIEPGAEIDDDRDDRRTGGHRRRARGRGGRARRGLGARTRDDRGRGDVRLLRSVLLSGSSVAAGRTSDGRGGRPRGGTALRLGEQS